MNNTNNEFSESSRSAYESLACEVLEIEAQGVLCASRDVDITGAGEGSNQLELYNGRSL